MLEQGKYKMLWGSSWDSNQVWVQTGKAAWRSQNLGLDRKHGKDIKGRGRVSRQKESHAVS